MLVLNRSVGEAITITTADGIEIIVAVLGVSGKIARIGVQAPKTVTIDREEVTARKRRQQAHGYAMDGG